MRHKAFAVRDSKLGVFRPPFWTPHTGQALRSLQEAVNDHNTEVAKYPDDFQLFEVGEFDDETGLLYPHESPRQIATAAEYVKRAPELKSV